MNTLAYRLSPQQKAILQQDGFNTVCTLTFNIDTNADVNTIKEHIVAIARNHIVFRLSFIYENKELLQAVGDDVNVIFSNGTYTQEVRDIVNRPPLQVAIQQSDNG